MLASLIDVGYAVVSITTVAMGIWNRKKMLHFIQIIRNIDQVVIEYKYK